MTNKKNIFVHIGARGNSQGLKNKNIRNFLGKPLISWTVLQAKKLKKRFKKEIKIVVNSDSKKILTISKNYGAEILIKRPKKLASANCAKFLVWKNSIEYLKKNHNLSEQDIFFDLDCTCPLREFKDIIKILKLFEIKKKKVYYLMAS